MTTPCSYCALPVRCHRVEPDRPIYCCSGCAIAHQIPVDAHGQFPVNKALIGSLVLAFVFFNQALFALLNGLLLHQQKLETAARFGWLSIASGAVVWLITLTIQLSAAGAQRHRFDLVLWVGSLGLHGFALASSPPSLTCMLLANLALLSWASRGLWRRRTAKK